MINEPRQNRRRDKAASEPSAALMRTVLLTGLLKFADVYRGSDENTAATSSNSTRADLVLSLQKDFTGNQKKAVEEFLRVELVLRP